MNLNKDDKPRLIPHKLNGYEFHPTCLETYIACPRKYYFQSLLGLTPKKSIINFHFGSAYHAGVGVFHTVRGMKGKDAVKLLDTDGEYSDALIEDNFNLAKTMSLKAFIEYWDSKRVAPSDKKNRDTGIIIVGKYCDRYERDQAEYEADMIEAPLVISMENNTTMVLTIDRINRAGDDYITVVDNKTSGWALTDFFWVGFKNSFQMLSYDHAVATILGHCEANQIDAALVPWKSDLSFGRKTNMFTKMQKESWYNTYEKATCKICSTLTQYPIGSEQCLQEFPCCHTSCSNYGGCGFLPVCQYGLDHPAVKTQFEFEDKREEY